MIKSEIFKLACKFEGKHIMATNAHVMMALAEEVEWIADDFNKNKIEACRVYPGEGDSEKNISASLF